MQKLIIATVVLCSTYAAANILDEPSTPPVMQPAATATRAPASDAIATVSERSVVEIPSEEASAPATPQPVAQVAHLPAAGGFCANGSCGPAAASRRVVVQRPPRSGGRIFKRRN